jgi:hypothetical protein
MSADPSKQRVILPTPPPFDVTIGQWVVESLNLNQDDATLGASTTQYYQISGVVRCVSDDQVWYYGPFNDEPGARHKSDEINAMLDSALGRHHDSMRLLEQRVDASNGD